MSMDYIYDNDIRSSMCYK